jgi:hypothetical protein
MGPWIEIISTSILTLKELMDISYNFLDTLITHFDRLWHGTIFLSLFSLLCLSVCLSPPSSRSAMFTFSLWFGGTSIPCPHLPPAPAPYHRGKRGKHEGFLSNSSVGSENRLADKSLPGSPVRKEIQLAIFSHSLFQTMLSVHLICANPFLQASDISVNKREKKKTCLVEFTLQLGKETIDKPQHTSNKFHR